MLTYYMYVVVVAACYPLCWLVSYAIYMPVLYTDTT